MGAGRHQPPRVSLLDCDPDLGADLPADEFEQARGRSVAAVVEVPGPRWDPAPLRRAADPGWLGLFVVRGFMTRTVAVGGRTACELFGPGDIIRPWDADGEYEPLPITLAWQVLRSVRLAVLDTAFVHRIATWPPVSARIVGRIADRARYLALLHAVSQVPRTDGRLLILFWMLADRWGTMTPDGITLTVPLTHELLATIVGVRRPAVTLALGRLADAELLQRLARDRWRLTRAAVEHLHQPESLTLVRPARTP